MQYSTAIQQTGLRQIEGMMKLALRTQSQSRATIETLSNVKNPRQFITAKQANIAEVQQVNNGPSPALAPEKEYEKAPNRRDGSG